MVGLRTMAVGTTRRTLSQHRQLNFPLSFALGSFPRRYEWIFSPSDFIWKSFARPFSTRAAKGDIIGIDFGTTNCSVAVMEEGNPKLIEDEQGKRSTPSVVAFEDSGEPIVGAPAGEMYPDEQFSGIKRLLGRRFNDCQAKKLKEMVPYSMVSFCKEEARIKGHSPCKIASFILKKMKKVAKYRLKREVSEAVIAVPSCFNDAQKKAVEEASKHAGLDLRDIIYESIAAGLSYGCRTSNKGDGRIAVFDLGGGTFDISILEKDQDGFFSKVKSRKGAILGGVDFDHALLWRLVNEFQETKRIQISNDLTALHKFREAAEKAKIDLSRKDKTDINVKDVACDKRGYYDFSTTLSASDFDYSVNHLIKEIEHLCRTCLNEARIDKNKLEDVILVGGMSRAPSVRKIVKDVFGKSPSDKVNPDEAVALGAAIRGAIISQKH